MTEAITTEKKKKFIRWFLENYQLKHRAATWVLNYLLNHEIVLNKLHIVEHADKSPRGIIMSTWGVDFPDFQFHKNARVFSNPEQAFHDIRLNWHYDLYLELKFPKAWQHIEYLDVLEDNPYQSWNDTVPDEIEDLALEALDRFHYGFYQDQCYQKVEEALENGNAEDFYKYTEKLKRMQKLSNL